MDMVLFPYRKLHVASAWLRNAWIYAKSSHVEISAIGTAQVQGDLLTITKPLHWLEQEGSTGHTELDMDAVAATLTDMVSGGIDPSEVRVWYHTHPKMQVFMSLTDKKTIKDLGRMMRPVVAVCANDVGSLFWEISEDNHNVTWEQQLLIDPPTAEEIKEARVLLKKYVTEVTPVWGSTGYRGLCSQMKFGTFCCKSYNHKGPCSFTSYKSSWV